MSIRLRLTLLYSAILALTLLVFGGVLYTVVAQASLSAATDRLKADSTIVIAAAFRGRPDATLPDLTSTDLTIGLRHPDGTVVPASPGQQQAGGTLPLDATALSRVQNGDSVGPYVATVGGQEMLLYDTPLVFRGQFAGILQFARPLSAAQPGLDTVRHVLLAAGVVATLLAFGVGWALAGTALRPLARLTGAARAIGEAQDFDRRVDYHGPPDELGRLATTFNAMLASLAAAYHAQRRFVADASHELRTPLTSIRGNLSLLQREPPIAPADRQAVLADLVGETERLSRLVGDLLTLARSDAGRPLRREPVALVPLLADLARRLAAPYPARALTLPHPSALAALADPDALTQVLLILLDNALKFTERGDTVAVEAEERGETVALTVRDSGPGIAPDAIPHIFDRFYQVDAARAGAGTGLGLAIAQALVARMGGTIAVESQPGHGSAFTVSLPRATVATASPVPLASAS